MSSSSDQRKRRPISSHSDLEELLDSVISRAGGDSERKQIRSKRREQQILRAALRVFARDGISAARISDIAAEAGLPLASLYAYFPSKLELAYAVPNAQLVRFYLEYMQAVADKHTYRERLYLYLRFSADFSRRNPEWARVLYLEIWPSVLLIDTPIRRMIDDYFRVVLFLISRGEESREWPAGHNHYEIATVLIGSLNQIVINWLLYRRPTDLMKAIDSAVKLTMTLLESTGKSPRKYLSKRRRPSAKMRIAS